MTDYESLLLVIAVVGVIWWMSRWPVWHRCRCGRQYCTGCGKER